MVEVVLSNTSADKMLSIVKELKEQGLVLDKDFSFKYEPAQYNNDGWSQVTSRRSVFTFYNEKYATLFALKYS
jgi:hypothetical protein